MAGPENTVELGLRQNWRQFALLVLINAFVGGMVGLERSIFPQLADEVFGIAAHSAVLSFIVAFGLTKALANYYTGALANKFGRKRLLVIGWLIALPVPWMLMLAPSWGWVVAANVLLGVSQGLTWSSTVMMKIDLVGEKNRGLAMGLNEFAGYFAVALVAFFSAAVASAYGIRPYPFYIGVALSVLGLLGSCLFVRETQHHAKVEQQASTIPALKRPFWDTTWLHRNLGSVSQAGFVNNLNDGMVWGILPVLLAQRNFSLAEIGQIAAIYPAVWGLSQVFTGKLADHICKKTMLFWGMFGQGIAIVLMIWATGYWGFVTLSVVLGFGTAMVYPTFLATIAENTSPVDRAHSIGIFRLWRDLGYAVGALLTGLIADWLGLLWSIGFIGFLTILSSAIIEMRMRCRNNPSNSCDNSKAFAFNSTSMKTA
ncbi:MAG: MFS transporter [Saprospiraceae bacterium]|nr:MFS transporter [Saprospiraceae bacterium]